MFKILYTMYALGIAATVGNTLSVPIMAALGHGPSEFSIIFHLASWYITLNFNPLWPELWEKWKR